MEVTAAVVVLALLGFAFATTNINEERLSNKASPNFFKQKIDDDIKIVGGISADIRDFPWQVGLLKKGSQYCAGALIAPKVVLTAAHCLMSSIISEIAELSVRSGSNFYIDGGLVIAAQRFIVHPLYVDKTCRPKDCLPYYDIAVIHLAAKATASGLPAAPIALWDANTTIDPGTLATVTGWGVTSERGFKSLQLQRVDIPVVANAKCNSIYETIVNGTRIICAGYDEGGKDACQGDSGGPFVIQNKLAGIVATGVGCAEPKAPGFYTNVAGFRNWIQQNAGV